MRTYDSRLWIAALVALVVAGGATAQALTNTSGTTDAPSTVDAAAGTHPTPVATPDANESAASAAAPDDMDVEENATPEYVLAGHVMAAGSPIAGARIDAWNDEDEASAITGLDGAYALALSPGVYALHLTAPKGYADQHEHDYVLNGSAERSFELRASGLLTGLVTNARGEPIEGAQVALFDADGDGASTTTDEEGRYLVELPDGEYRIEIEAGGYQGYAGDGVLVAAGKLSFHDAQLEDTGHDLSGTVDINGHPAHNVLILVLHIGADGTIGYVNNQLTDASGHWSMGPLADGSYTLIAIAHEARVVSGVTVSGEDAAAPNVHFDIQGWAQ